ncbi:delta-aminolevulinic acid dehydratase [Natranaerobius trueperi]|uniref:Delta-aminolevulinic acid dehydratase n=2 Tax=Natranaerobius trueperi TaxID=759412 RepID=A0A226BX43_9FIRM|nr:delta-aminolevulinic acid dehydratase [Natranaerobius trueperi]
MRRLRRKQGIRHMVRENQIQVTDLIYPIFVTTGENYENPVPSMPGVYQYSVDMAIKHLEKVYSLGIPAVMLFGVPGYKDERGSSAKDPNEAIQRACSETKKHFPDLIVITDVCMCGFTNHGHCGILKDGDIDNDLTLKELTEIAISHSKAGADMLAPSNMMDGYVKAIRQGLDKHGYENIPIMAYSAKFASNFYGPFRDAAYSSPSQGDRKTYQMDSANGKEAIREVELDINEGADIVMVKPGLSYLDVIKDVKQSFRHPVAAYNVSGEYAMIKAATEKGWLDEKQIVMEVMTSYKRAGADMILTYFAIDIARWLNNKEE